MISDHQKNELSASLLFSNIAKEEMEDRELITGEVPVRGRMREIR